MTEHVVLEVKLTIVEYPKIEILEFTHDRPFHLSQRHSKLSNNQIELSGKMRKVRKTVKCVLPHWLMTKPSEVRSRFRINTQQC